MLVTVAVATESVELWVSLKNETVSKQWNKMNVFQVSIRVIQRLQQAHWVHFNPIYIVAMKVLFTSMHLMTIWPLENFTFIWNMIHIYAIWLFI